MLLSEQMRLVRDQHQSERDSILQRMTDIHTRANGRPDKALLASEQRDFDALKAQKRDLDEVVRGDSERLEELLTEEARAGAAAESRAKYGSAHVTSEPGPYRKDDRSTSFFLDLRSARRGDSAAIERLARNQAQAVTEKRAGDMTSNVAGTGAEFAPPLWMVQDYVTLARPGRVTADLCTKNSLPAGHSSINLPAVARGTSTAVQTTQNSAISDTAMTTTSLSTGITTIAGKQILSLQLVEQSGAPIDQVVFRDLAADHAERLDLSVLSGAGAPDLAGILGVSGVNTVTYTTTSPVVTSSTNAASFLYQVLAATGKTYTGIFRAPDSVVMHPRRWLWVLNALDTTNRPLVVPQGAQFNGPAVSTEPRAEGAVGVFGGLDVFVDPNIPTNIGAATNQDQVFTVKRDEIWLWESELKAEAFDATLADQLSLLVRVYSYAGLIANRRPKAISIISGTGLVDPGLG